VRAQVRGLANLSPQFFVGTFAIFVGFILEIMAEETPGANEADEAAKEGEADVEGDGEADGTVPMIEAADERLLSSTRPRPNAT
jgi:hypothetical protein